MQGALERCHTPHAIPPANVLATGLKVQNRRDRHGKSHRQRVGVRIQAQQPSVSSSSSSSSSSQPAEAAQLRFADGHTGQASSPVEAQRQTNGNGADITLHYYSGWRRPTVLYSVQGGDWQRREMQEVASSSGRWKCATFALNGGSRPDAPLLEFVITDNGACWDKPIDGGNYIIQERGRFALCDGQVAAVHSPSVLLVSDLDDTIIGDDDATAAFKRKWESAAVPRGSRLVYNTGRALHKCQSLFAEKAAILPKPDYLITSVGTKVYCYSDGQWAVDAEHVAKLDEGWDLDVVRDAAYAALAKVGKDHFHFRPADEQSDYKVTCGVSVAALEKVLDRIQQRLDAGKVKARLISSGSGDWRFLDIVPVNAGKLEAMSFVQQKLGFASEATVAAGDSGNDIAMFEGDTKAIIVSNAQSDLLRWLEKQRQQEQDTGNVRLLLTKLPRADGILEGLKNWGYL